MTVVQSFSLPDVQASGDDRGVTLDEVGISGFSMPISVQGPKGDVQPTVAVLEMTVEVPAAVKGTHMSRFIEQARQMPPLTPRVAFDLARSTRLYLDAPSSTVEVRFPLFTDRAAPATAESAPHRYDALIRASSRGAETRVVVGVTAPVTSLCPCSREISDYGAHSQRGVVTVEVESTGWADGDGVWPHELFAYADEAGSAQIYPLLKRLDERAVTMGAYDTPAFVEDIARNVAVAVRRDLRCTAWSISVANQESIHAHEAIARVKGRR